jgi:hypothetical protein
MYDYRLWKPWVQFSSGVHYPGLCVSCRPTGTPTVTPTGTPTGTPTVTPTVTPTGIALSWMPTTDDPYCGFCVWLVQCEMDQVWLWLELGWVGFSCVQGEARLGLVVFVIRSGLV